MGRTRRVRRLLGGLVVLLATACTTTVTEADLHEAEAGRAAEARSEEKRDAQIGEEGGEGMLLIREGEARSIDDSNR